MIRDVIRGGALVFVLAANLVWFEAKRFLKLNGYPADWAWHHFRDFRSLSELAASGCSPVVRRGAARRLRLLTALGVAFLVVVAPAFFWAARAGR